MEQPSTVVYPEDQQTKQKDTKDLNSFKKIT